MRLQRVASYSVDSVEQDTDILTSPLGCGAFRMLRDFLMKNMLYKVLVRGVRDYDSWCFCVGWTCSYFLFRFMLEEGVHSSHEYIWYNPSCMAWQYIL